MQAVFDQFAGCLGRLLVRPDKQSVYEMRVACRKLNAWLSLFPRKRRRKLQQVVKGLFDHCGRVRDEQLLSFWTGKTFVEREMAKLQEYLQKHSGDFRVKRKRFARPEPERVARRMEKLVGRARTLGKAVEKRPSKDVVHRLRIELKKLRYTVEVVFGLESISQMGPLAPLVQAQKLLGAYQDGALAAERMQEPMKRNTLRHLAQFRRLWRKDLAARIELFVPLAVAACRQRGFSSLPLPQSLRES